MRSSAIIALFAAVTALPRPTLPPPVVFLAPPYSPNRAEGEATAAPGSALSSVAPPCGAPSFASLNALAWTKASVQSLFVALPICYISTEPSLFTSSAGPAMPPLAGSFPSSSASTVWANRSSFADVLSFLSATCMSIPFFVSFGVEGSFIILIILCRGYKHTAVATSSPPSRTQLRGLCFVNRLKYRIVTILMYLCDASGQSIVANVNIIAGSGSDSVVDGYGESASFGNDLQSIGLDTHGVIYVTDNNHIRTISNNRYVSTPFGNGLAASTNGIGTMAAFNIPWGLCFDKLGMNFYVSESFGQRIRLIISSSKTVSTFAGSGNSAFANGIGASASFSYPRGLFVDSTGDVFVADSGNGRIRKISSSGVVTSLAGRTTQFSSSTDGLGTSATFEIPFSIVGDDAGFLYVADGSPPVLIRKISPLGLVSTLAGKNTGYVNGVGTAASFDGIKSLALDMNGNLFVGDGANLFIGDGRIRIVTPGGTVSALPGVKITANGLIFDSYGNLLISSGPSSSLYNVSLQLCPGGFFCPANSSLPTVFNMCPPSTYCPPGSFAPISCPADSSGLLVAAGSLEACYVSNSSSSSLASGGGASGSSCSSNASCSSSTCLSGFCCNDAAKALGCLSCQPGTGSCALLSPGEACASAADCGTNLCLGGCCCANSAVQTLGCTACTCWANASTSAATAGSCGSSSLAATTNTTLQCNASVSLPAAVPLSRVIAFPSSANVSDASPLMLLPATSPLNTYGEDIIVATASACAAFTSNGAATQCASFSYALSSGTYYYLGSAASLGMTSTPSCAA